MREVFKALRWLARAGSPWRYLPGDFPPWSMVYQQTQRWIPEQTITNDMRFFQARVFEDMVDDVRETLRKPAEPTAMVLDS